MSDPAVTTPAPQPDPYADDPFFRRRLGTHWNACIGKQGDEENYLDGYIEAAKELSDAVIDQKMFEKRDTLVLPILYNARHAVELVLKFVTDRLVQAGVMPHIQRRNHDSLTHWNALHDASPGDEKLLQTIQTLKPFVDSLSRIDNDGQELRYHLNRSNDPSMSGYSIANLEVIRTSLADLTQTISILKNRTLTFIDEVATGACTTRCSRRDLVTIAQLLPRRELWRSDDFDRQKDVIRKRYGLGNRQFAKALDAIQANREMKAIIGVETDLLHVSDEDLVWVVEQWRRIHPPKDEDDEAAGGIDYFDLARFDGMKERLETESAVVSAIEERMTDDEIADIEAMFYLTRDHISPEYYERLVEQAKKEHAAEKDPQAEIAHLMEKTNFLSCLQQAATKLGRPSLAKRLAEL